MATAHATRKRPPSSIRSQRAFTLIEMMVVVSIIIILAAISVGVYVSVQTRAAGQYTRTTLGQMQGLWNDYLKDNPDPFLTAAPPALKTDTSPFSDDVVWVRCLRAFPGGKALNDLKKSPSGDMVLDAWGNAIRYVPPLLDATGKELKQRYFFSFGPDGKPNTQDDLYSITAF